MGLSRRRSRYERRSGRGKLGFGFFKSVRITAGAQNKPSKDPLVVKYRYTTRARTDAQPRLVHALIYRPRKRPRTISLRQSWQRSPVFANFSCGR